MNEIEEQVKKLMGRCWGAPNSNYLLVMVPISHAI